MVTWKQVGSILLGLLVVGLILYLVPRIEVFGWDQVLHPQKISPAFYKRDVFAQEDRARQTLATILGGLAVLAGAALTLRSVRAAEKSAEIARDNAETARKVAEQNAETAQRNIKIAEDKQITDRLTAAINNLSTDSPDKMAVRLGGIYALKRIANDSPEDYRTVMEVLTAYIRDKCPKLKGEELAAAESFAALHGSVDKVLSTDIQAIVTVIRERNPENDDDKRLDLHEVDLVGANLGGADLRGADLGGADLRGANLGGADLRGAYLGGADLGGAYLDGADLDGADLGGANLVGAYMADCRNLTQQQLDSANQAFVPASLPPGLTFPGYSAPDPAPAPPA